MGDCFLKRVGIQPLLQSFNADLLWTNSSSTSAFSASSITVDYTNYSYLLVWFKDLALNTDESFTSAHINGQLIYVGNTSNNMVCSCSTSDGNYIYQYCRYVIPTAAKTSLGISTTGYYGYRNTSASGGYSTGTGYCIPLRIYGVTIKKTGKCRSLFPTDYPTGSGTVMAGSLASGSTLNISKHYKYLLCYFQSRDEVYDTYDFDVNWFCKNQVGGTRTSGRFGTTAYSASSISVIQENTNRWVAGGHRYESSNDLLRGRYLSYANKTITATSNTHVAMFTSAYYEDHNYSDSGIKMIWGLNKPLW